MQARSYRFTVLRHSLEQYAYYWLLRTPAAARGDHDEAASLPSEFSGVLLSDLVADTTPFVNETRQYVRVDFQRDDDVRPLCADEYEICWDDMMQVRLARRAPCGLGGGVE